MSNPEIKYYDATPEQGEIAYESAQKSGRSIDQEYEKMGIKPIKSDKSPELGEKDQAAILLGALKYDLSASKLSGLTSALESSHPDVNQRFDHDRINENESKEKIYRKRADESIRRLIGSRVLEMAGYRTRSAPDEFLAELPNQFYRDFTGKENQKKRTSLRRKLTKIIKQND